MNISFRRWSRLTKGRWLLAGTGAIVLMSVVVLLAGIELSVQGKDVSALEHAVPTPTVIYDAQGREAAKIVLSKTDGVRLEQIPDHLIQAVIAIEDKRFYNHHGWDTRAISRAAVRNAVRGGIVEGGSTITQQLAKNVFLTHEKSFGRKWEELLYAVKVERTYSKDQIMEMYLNQIYFGEGAWGVKRAAAVYFGKDVSSLSVGESALLAGLVQAPSRLSPYKQPDEAIHRRNIVLKLMEEQGWITAEERKTAEGDPIVLAEKSGQRQSDRPYPYYIDHLLNEAEANYGLTENDVLYGGLHIYTELDPQMQQAVESVYADDTLFPASTEDQLIQSGTILLDPSTGAIRALIGGRGEHVFRGYNRATQLKRQPGSAMKPLAVYAPALAAGYRPDELLNDKPIDYAGYSPKNFDGRYRGLVTMYEAMLYSYNVPAVDLLNRIGVQVGVDSVKRFGIPLTEEDRGLSLALGGLHEGTSPLKMAEAFSAFASGGAVAEPHAIRRIVAPDGRVVAETFGEKRRVIEEDIAQWATYLLQGVVEEGTGKEAKIAGRPTAGKTGTTQLPFGNGSGVKDNWFVGYTPELVGAVWLGYDYTDEQHYLTTSSRAAAILFREIMTRALEGHPVVPFDQSLIQTWRFAPSGDEQTAVNGKGRSKKEEQNRRKEAEKERKKLEKEQKKQEKKKQKVERKNREKAKKKE